MKKGGKVSELVGANPAELRVRRFHRNRMAGSSLCAIQLIIQFRCLLKVHTLDLCF